MNRIERIHRTVTIITCIAVSLTTIAMLIVRQWPSDGLAVLIALGLVIPFAATTLLTHYNSQL